MTSITEGKLCFHFRDDWCATKYDDWNFYQHKFKDYFGGTRGVDIVAFDPNQCLWLIEIKDYREHKREKDEDLAIEVARKVRDTMSGLAVAQRLATTESEQRFAQKVLKYRQIRVVLHLEQPLKHSKL